MTDLEQALHLIDTIKIPDYFSYMKSKVGEDNIELNMLEKKFIHGKIDENFYDQLKVLTQKLLGGSLTANQHKATPPLTQHYHTTYIEQQIIENKPTMDIGNIFSKILTATKITVTAIAALSVTGIVYLLDKKLGVIDDDDLTALLLLVFFGTVLLVLMLIIFFELRKQTLENELKKAELKDKNKGSRNINMGGNSQYFENNSGTINNNPK